MSVISWRELPGEEYSESKDGVREYRRKFLAETDTGFDSPETVKNYYECPQRWELHPTGINARVISRRATQQTKGGRFWDVEIFYTNDFRDDTENPLERPPVIEWSSVEYAIAVPTDLEGKPFVSTSGEPLAEVMVESPGLVANISVNVPEKPTWFRKYLNSVNNGAITFDDESFGKGDLRMKSLSVGGFVFDQGVWYRQLKMQLQSRDGGWQKRLINRGYYEVFVKNVKQKNGKNKKKYEYKQIKIDGTPAVEPQLLDADGKYLDLLKDGVLDPEQMQKVVVLDFKVRHDRDYSILPLK